MIRGVIFDLGNTLMYFKGNWDTVYRQGIEALTRDLRAQGFKLSERLGEDFLRLRSAGRDRSVRTNVEYTATEALREALSKQGYPEPGDDVIAHALECFFAPEEEQWVAYEDTLETLAQLRDLQFRLGAISNATDDSFIQHITRSTGVYPFLNPIISSAAMPYRKPDPRIFQHLLDQWQMPAAEVVMVGDGPGVDILGAHRAGMQAILLEGRPVDPWHLAKELNDPELCKPDLSLPHLHAIIPALERLNSRPQ